MILILLLSIFSTAQLGQGAIEPGDANSIEASVQYCAADFFPADTLGVMEFSLEPWDRVGEETLAYSVLKQVTALQAFSDQAQHLFEQDYGDSGANIQLRSLLGGARFYFGFPSSLAQEESGIIGIDLTSQAFADQVESILNQMESDYRRVGDSFLILSFTGSGPRWSSGKRARFLEECIDKQRPNTPAADCLAFFPTWQGLRKELDHENRVFGFWIPTEAWREHGRQFVNFALEQQDDPEYLKEFTDIFIDALELEKIEGLAFTTDIEAPLFRDRFLMVGKSKIDDLYQPFSSDPKKTWQRLAQSSATALEITIGGVDSVALCDLLVEVIVRSLNLSSDVDISDTQEFQEYVTPVIALAQVIGPGFAFESSAEDIDSSGISRLFVEYAEKGEVMAAWDGIAADVKIGLQFALASQGKAIHSEWLANGVLLADAPIDKETPTIGNTPGFKSALLEMKAAAGDKAPLWVVYQPEIYNTLIITTLFEVLPTFYQKMEQSLEVEMPPFVGEIAEVDFPPAYFLARRNSDAILTQGRSTFGLVSSQMILSLKEVLVEEMAAEDLEFHEGEF